MRVVAALSSNDILQVEKTPDVGDARPTNGRFVIPIPEMVAVDVDSSSYIQPVDGNDVASLAMAALLVQFPMYSNVVFNPLISAADIADLDLAAIFPTGSNVTRAVVGRGAGPLPIGNAPNKVCILNRNQFVAPARPGILISDTIDIGPMTGGVGADEYLVWWKLYSFSTSQDVSSSFGVTAGVNDPAIVNIQEIDPEPAGFEVWISHDDGVTYTQVDRVTPMDLVTFGTLVRIAFRNTNNSQKRWLASYAILF